MQWRRVDSGIMGVSIILLVTPSLLAKTPSEGKPPGQNPPAAEPETRRKLFDGRSLRGWSGDKARWTIGDGAISGRSDPSGAAALVSDDRFGSFRLTFSVRVGPGGEGSVCFWGRRPSEARAWSCPGLAFTFPTPGGWDGRSGKSLTWKSVHSNPVKDGDAWIDVEILADMHTGRVRMAENGIEVLDYVDPEPTRLGAGPLSFQTAASAGPPRQIQIKNVLVDTAPRTGVLLTVNLCGVQTPAEK